MQNGGRGKTICDFERDAAPSLGPDAASLWEPLTQGDLKDTQTLIERTLGLTRETFRASAMLAQGDGGSFCEAQPRDRKRILADALGLSLWDECKNLAGKDRRDRETQCEALAGRVQLLDEQLAGTDTLAEDVRALTVVVLDAEAVAAARNDRVTAARDEHEQLAALAQAAAAARATLNTAKAEHASLERERAAAGQAAEQARELEQSLPHLQARATELDTLQAEREELTAARHEQQLREQQRAALTLELEQVTSSRQRSSDAADETAKKHRQILDRIQTLQDTASPDVRCDRCQQHLPDEAKALAVASNQREADDLAAQHQRHTRDHVELGERVEKVRAQLAEIEPSLPDDGRYNAVVARCSELARAREDLAAAAERIAGLTAAATLRDTFADELAAAERNVADATRALVDAPDEQAVTDARRRLAEAEAAKTVAAQRAETAKVDLATARARLQIIEKARGERDQALAERDRLQGDLDELMLLERAFGRDGVPTWILETSAIPALEVEADRLLGLSPP
jgi:exonuclease SbcC